ncbi:MAG: TetR/AcrR family transcriptional regulator, partial [Bacillota bacterium]
MTIEDRRDREKSQMKDLIIKAAAQIIITEGYDKLSVRKLANQIEYSPAIIYHYFKNKDDIVNQIMRQGYQDLMAALTKGQSEGTSPEDRLKLLTRKYITAALHNPDQFLAIQLNKSPAILDFTSYLFEGASEKKPALKLLTQTVRDICQGQNKSECESEMTAQIIAASTLGLTTRLILEKNISENKRQQLIEHFTDSIV